MPKMKYQEFKGLNDEKGAFDFRRYLENKYFGLFLNRFKFENVTNENQRYLLKKLWSNGCAAAFIIEGTRKEPTLNEALFNSSPNTITNGNVDDNGLICFVPFAVDQWNIQDEPSVVTLINQRGAKFIPTKRMVVNKDVVIIWAHKSHMPVRSLISYYIDQMCDVQKCIDMNLFVHKLPRLVTCSPEDEARVKELMEKIENGEKKLFLSTEDVQAIKDVLSAGQGNYIIDKLKMYLQVLDNELLTFLGINNVPIEKKERLVTGEVESNDQLIEESGDCFEDTIRESCENVEKVLQYPMRLKERPQPEKVEEVEENEGEDEDVE